MADNYLERKMEEHRRTQASTPAVRRKPSPGIALKRIAVNIPDAETTEQIVKHFRKAGHKVAFTLKDSARGTALAQSSGSRFYPAPRAAGMIDDLQRVWGGLDIIITEENLQNFLQRPGVI